MLNEITFYQRFQANILNGSKTITIRDASEKDFTIGSTVDVFTFEQHQWFAKIKILAITAISFQELTDTHAQQENMTLSELKTVIQEIYPNTDQLFVIHYQLVES
ncbi:N(4)-acetylcytidine aminohydrolase [Gallibacterium trehalosifermentans]|uniref:N(4)-acetylcytidine amidohydrolase n=1 Tax=Gallibacterium trehalosifermentans TaxID=516935 RepID=A0ABV6H2P4_9PAST